MRTICVVLLVFALGAFASGCQNRVEPTEPGKSKDTDKIGSRRTGSGQPRAEDEFRQAGHVFITINKSTTFVTGPLDSTGHIDYVAALNARTSQGVTAENNANVAIWKTFGPISPSPAPRAGRVL